MVGNYQEWMTGPLQPMPPLLKGQLDCEQFSVEKCHNFAPPGRAFLEKVVHGWSQEGFTYFCDKTAPTSVVDASNSTTKALSGSGWTRRGAVVKAHFSHWMAWVLSCDQDRDL